jgi:hypothetical protein
MKNKLIIFGLFLFTVAFTINTIAQKDFLEGYIIKNANDTTRGFIRYRDGKMSDLCIFKNGLKGETIEYTASEISGFRINDGKFFISKKAPVFKAEKVVFLEFLIKGKLNVYFMHDNSDHYYIEKEGGKLVELTEEESIYRDKYGDPIYKNNLYQGKIKSQVSDCMEVIPQVERTKLDHKSLIGLAKSYHTKICTDEQCIIFEHKTKSVRIAFEIHGGISLNNTNFGGFLNSDYNMGGIMGGNLVLENLVDWSQRSNLMLGLEIQGLNSYEFTVKEYVNITYSNKNYILSSFGNDSYPSSMELNLKALVLKIPLTLNHSFKTGKLCPTLGGGIANNFVIKQNSSLSIDSFVMKYGKSIPLYSVGLLLKAGLRYNLNERNSLYTTFSYEYSTSVNINAMLRFRMSSLTGTVGIQL